MNGTYTGFEFNAMVTHPSGDIILGGAFFITTTGDEAFIARRNPATGAMTSLGTGVNGRVEAVACAPNGDIYAAGLFTQAGGVPANSVAVFRAATQTWEALGAGIADQVTALSLLPNGEVYAVVTPYLASQSSVHRFDPSTSQWNVLCTSSPLGCLGGGTFPEIDAIAAMINGDVVIHTISNSTGVSVFQRWSASQLHWAPFYPLWVRGTNNYAPGRLLALPNGDLIMSAGNPPADGPGNIAYFSVSQNTFSPLGTGINGPASSLALAPDGTLVVSGDFTVAGGVNADSYARFNFSTGAWSALGSGAGDPADFLAPLVNGDVQAATPFFYLSHQAGGVMAPANLAQYISAENRWRSPRGVNGTVNAVVQLPDGDAIVGGVFSYAADLPTANIARYHRDTGTWTPLGTGTNGAVYALALLPSGEVAVAGAFTNAGGVAVSKIARYNPVTNAWSAWGGTGGIPTTFYALAVLPNGDVAAGGGSTLVSRRAVRWSASTSTWVSMGSIGFSGALGAGNKVLALAAAPNGDVFIGGEFPDPVEGVGNFRHWHAATNTITIPEIGTDGAVNALAVVPDGGVILGGEFSVVGNNLQSFSFARWNPTTSAWTAYGLGFDRPVRALGPLSTGDVLVGGEFTTVPGLTGTEHIALFLPSANTFQVIAGTTDYPNGGVRGHPQASSGSVLALASDPTGGFAAGGIFSFTSSAALAPTPVNNFAMYACAAQSGCDSIDFNGDSLFPDTDDIRDFILVFGGAPCPTGTCADIDFNNDGLFPDTDDIAALIRVFGGGACVP